MDYKFLVSATQDSAGSENAKIKIEVEGQEMPALVAESLTLLFE